MPPREKAETKPAADETKTEATASDQNEGRGDRRGESTPVPLAKSENLGKPGTTVVGDQEYELPSDTSVALKSLASQATSVDGAGVERVINRYVDGWEPAPLEPNPDEVKRLEKAREAFEAHRTERQNLLGLGSQSADEIQAEQEKVAEANREERPGAEQRPVEAASA